MKHTYCFPDGIINIKYFDPNNIKREETNMQK